VLSTDIQMINTHSIEYRSSDTTSPVCEQPAPGTRPDCRPVQLPSSPDAAPLSTCPARLSPLRRQLSLRRKPPESRAPHLFSSGSSSPLASPPSLVAPPDQARPLPAFLFCIPRCSAGESSFDLTTWLDFLSSLVYAFCFFSFLLSSLWPSFWYF
jgi:hypothetical protein